MLQSCAYFIQNLEHVLKADKLVKSIVEDKILNNKFVLKADRQAVTNVLVDELILKLGTWLVVDI